MKRLFTALTLLIILSFPAFATVSDTSDPIKIYSGTATSYPITFEYIDDSDVEVTLVNATTGAETAQTLDVDYTISADTVVYTTAPGSTYNVVLHRATPRTQEVAFSAGSAPPITAYGSAFDKLTYITQELDEKFDRSILLPESSVAREIEWPDLVINKGKLVRINAAGTGLEGIATVAAGSALDVTAYCDAADLTRIHALNNESSIVKANEYATLKALLTAIGSTPTTVIVDTALTVSTAGTIPTTAHVIVMKGGSFAIATGCALTINGTFTAPIQDVFDITGTGSVAFGASSLREVHPEWFGAYYGGDCTAAIQYALDAAPAGGRVKLQPYDYLTTSTITIEDKNRITLEGDGLSTGIKFSPTTNDDVAIAIDGDCDNVTLSNFNLVYSNNGSRTGGVGCRVYTGATVITFDRVYFADWLDKALEMDVAYYAKIKNCRFMNCDNSSNFDALAVGLYITTGANNTTIEGCIFTTNDYALRILGGNAVTIRDSVFEANGDSGNAFGVSSQISIANTNNLNFENNYVEGNYTGNTNAVLDVDTCYGTIIKGTYWSGQTPGNVDVSDRLIGLTDSYETIIEGNVFSEWKDYCVTANTGGVTLRRNIYEDGGVRLTAHNTIHDHMSITGGASFGIPVSFTWDPGSLADGAGETKSVTVDGAAAGDSFVVSGILDLHDATVTAYVQAANTVEVRLQNESGGVLDLASGTWYIHIIKKQ